MYNVCIRFRAFIFIYLFDLFQRKTWSVTWSLISVTSLILPEVTDGTTVGEVTINSRIVTCHYPTTHHSRAWTDLVVLCGLLPLIGCIHTTHQPEPLRRDNIGLSNHFNRLLLRLSVEALGYSVVATYPTTCCLLFLWTTPTSDISVVDHSILLL